MKPSWDEAPSWAWWLAMDSSGAWCWHENKPWPQDGAWVGGDYEEASKEDIIQWTSTLEARPCSPPPSP